MKPPGSCQFLTQMRILSQLPKAIPGHTHLSLPAAACWVSNESEAPLPLLCPKPET